MNRTVFFTIIIDISGKNIYYYNIFIWYVYMVFD